MAQRRFTKTEADEAIVAVNKIFEAHSRTKQLGLIDALTKALLFLCSAKDHAPEAATEEAARLEDEHD